MSVPREESQTQGRITNAGGAVSSFGAVEFVCFLTAFISSLIPLWMSLPLVALLLKVRGYEEDVVGVLSAMPWVGLMLTSPWVPKLVRRIGTDRALALGTLIGSAALLLFCTTSSLILWFALNFAQGIGLGIRWVAADTWVNAKAPEDKRGRINGIYDMLTGGAVGLGPTLLIWLGSTTVFPFLVGCGIGIASLAPLWIASKGAPALTETSENVQISVWRIFHEEPIAFLGLGLAGFAEATSLALLPLYGLSYQLGDQAATLLITFSQAGVLAGSVLFGFLADRLDRITLILWSVAVSALAPGLLPIVISHFSQWPTLFIWGVGQGGAFVVGMIILGSRFASRGLTEAMTLAMIAYTFGGLTGPSLVGLMSSRLGADAQPLTLMTCGALIFAAMMFLRPSSRAADHVQ